jgi:TolB-like protein/Tfp pilus assembly protein PilF
MKRCPECRRDYFDDSLLYCLDDGAALLEGPGSLSSSLPGAEEPQTAILHETDAPAEASTKHFLHTTDLSGMSAVPVVDSKRDRSFARTFAVIAGIVIVAVGAFLGYRYFTAATTQISSIAVMPFVNESGNTDIDYLSDGMTDTLISSLSQLPDLTVKARSAVFRYKGTAADAQTVGRALNAQAVLNGHVVQRGDQLTVNLELIDSGTENVIWAGQYDRKLADLVSIQKDITRDVVSKLTSKLSRTDEQKLGHTYTSNADAYRLLLQGRYFLDRSTRDDTEKAIGYFQQAFDLDPACAICMADLGRAYAIQAGRAWAPEADAFARSREATKKALSIDPALAEGYAQLGRIQATYDLDLRGAEASYRKALDLAPSSASVQDGAAVLFYKLGKFDEAIKLSHRAIDDDPLSPSFYHNLGLTCLSAGRLAESEEAFRKAVELAHERIVTNALLAIVLLDQGRTDDAVDQAGREPDLVWKLWSTAIINHRIGRDPQADAAIKELVSQHSNGNAFQIAEVYAVRGDADGAFRWLETAYNTRDSGITHAKVDPNLASLHSDPRWGPYLKKLGLDG